ncbi:MAG TPA: hypothetical protein VNZ61_02695 [Roseomonas sp.]|nr:hypothetical protein [Roseomonas sp.]
MSAISRRAALLLPLAATLPGRARASLPPITDAIGRQVTLRAPAERIVLGFNFEEFTAVAGAEGWERVVGFNQKQWSVNCPITWERYRKAIPRLSGLTDIGDTETGTFSVERVLALRPDLLITPAAGYASGTADGADRGGGHSRAGGGLQRPERREARRRHARAGAGHR